MVEFKNHAKFIDHTASTCRCLEKFNLSIMMECIQSVLMISQSNNIEDIPV